MPPSIDTMNIMKRMMVREAVGNTSEAMRLADEPAGDANTKRMMINIYLRRRLSI